MAAVAGGGARWLALPVPVAMALEAEPVHHFPVIKRSCRLQALDTTGALGEKVMTDLAVPLPLLVLTVGEMHIAAIAGMDHDVLRASVLSFGAPPIRNASPEKGTQQKNHSLFQHAPLLLPVSTGV
jgi:hypothetical protein